MREKTSRAARGQKLQLVTFGHNHNVLAIKTFLIKPGSREERKARVVEVAVIGREAGEVK